MVKGRDAARAKLERLRSLDGAPEEQIALASRLVASERNVDVVQAAVAVLAARAGPALRPVLLRRYADCDRDGTRRDPGGALRSAILAALRPLLLPEDVPLLARATATYEFLYGESTGDLRAAGLLALNEVDHVLAAYHAARLLTDGYTSIMSGEPAVTAARVLAAQDQRLPLYAYVTRDEGGVADVLAECLRGLVPLPASLLPALVEGYRESADEIVLLGLFDLLLAHETRADYTGFLLDFLRATRHDNIFRYLVNTIIAGRQPDLIAHLEALAAAERDPRKRDILLAALALR